VLLVVHATERTIMGGDQPHHLDSADAAEEHEIRKNQRQAAIDDSRINLKDVQGSDR
jgi:hypothetical protein